MVKWLFFVIDLPINMILIRKTLENRIVIFTLSQEHDWYTIRQTLNYKSLVHNEHQLKNLIETLIKSFRRVEFLKPHLRIESWLKSILEIVSMPGARHWTIFDDINKSCFCRVWLFQLCRENFALKITFQSSIALYTILLNTHWYVDGSEPLSSRTKVTPGPRQSIVGVKKGSASYFP